GPDLAAELARLDRAEAKLRASAGSAIPASMAPRETLRTEIRDGVFIVTLTRAAEYNTITPAFRDELAAAIDEADADRRAHVILLRAEGPAFCAGYGLDWSTAAQAAETQASRAAVRGGAGPTETATAPDERRERVWDSV